MLIPCANEENEDEDRLASSGVEVRQTERETVRRMRDIFAKFEFRARAYGTIYYAAIMRFTASDILTSRPHTSR